jgi:hypothetical protein
MIIDQFGIANQAVGLDSSATCLVGDSRARPATIFLTEDITPKYPEASMRRKQFHFTNAPTP